ncbi:MAG TPA: DNA mismatch repair endonuclease MutL, partial [Blastocatellia bacterium]|nr:DNA mismatch repair endonuclease MutL [Blastocatellia bacterium]
MMAKIRILPDSLANKIAAGEVVERPSSVVKELLENALDAGARKIDIEVESGGKKLIRVIDDGEGMTRDDAIVAFERHATSKLRTADDLETITTLGFRGEALPSIASVSRLTLRTKTKSEVEGTEVEFNGGKLVAVRDTAWPGGTEIEVKDLFFNIPARRKFLKSDATESLHITNLVQHYALANPALAFMLVNNGREAIRVAPARSLKERAYQVLGGGLLSKLVEVEKEEDGLKVTGFVSNPQEQRSSKDAQYMFVNQRFVRDQLIGRAISEAYRSMMPSGAYPAVVLFIEVPPTEIDVNVHPAKTEIRFLRETAILAFIRQAVTDALRATQPIAKLPGLPTRASEADEAPPQPTWRDLRTNNRPPGSVSGQTRYDDRPRDESLPEGVQPPPRPRIPFEQRAAVVEEAGEKPGEISGSQPEASYAEPREAQTVADESAKAETGSLLESEPLPIREHGIKPLGQIRDSYIAATDDEGLLLVDQHAAHERVLFEQIRDTRLSRAPNIQPLLIPETIDLTPAEVEAFAVVQPELESLGIETMQLSGRTIAIKTAPAGISSTDLLALVGQALAVVERERRSFNLEDVRDQIAASVACKAAIKVNMPLTAEKMQWLIDELMK